LQAGNIPPPNQCSVAVQALFGPNDNCTSAVQAEGRSSFNFDTIFDPRSYIQSCPQRVSVIVDECGFIDEIIVSISSQLILSIPTLFQQLTPCDYANVELLGLKIFVPKQQLLLYMMVLHLMMAILDLVLWRPMILFHHTAAFLHAGNV